MQKRIFSSQFGVYLGSFNLKLAQRVHTTHTRTHTYTYTYTYITLGAPEKLMALQNTRSNYSPNKKSAVLMNDHLTFKVLHTLS
jgi:hypothetical protein